MGKQRRKHAPMARSSRSQSSRRHLAFWYVLMLLMLLLLIGNLSVDEVFSYTQLTENFPWYTF
jgi:hypothetical protein